MLVTPKLGLVAFLAIALCPIPASAWTVANLKGSYGFRFSGTDYAATGKQIVATGIFIADGAGNISGKGSITYNDGGNICTGTTLNSTYTIAADGEGTLNLQYNLSGGCPLGSPMNFAIAIAAPNKASQAATVQMSSTNFTVNETNTTNVTVAGVANRL